MSTPDHSSDWAIVACEQQVSDNLKSPSSAHFSNENASGDSNEYTVTGDVDADNSFGATSHNLFQCTVRLEDAHSSDASVCVDYINGPSNS